MFERSKGSVRENMQVLQKGGVVKEEDVKGAISRISYTPDITVCNGRRGEEKREREGQKKKLLLSLLCLLLLFILFSFLFLFYYLCYHTGISKGMHVCYRGSLRGPGSEA